MPLVSVIIPVYNAAAHLARCMDSLRAQTLPDIEVLFVDDLGHDNSTEIIRTYIAAHRLKSAWHILTMEQNGGPGKARNRGIEAAAGEYIAFVDADDWIEPQMLEILYKAAKQAQDADLSASATLWEDAGHSAIKVATNPYVGTGTITPARRRFLLRHFVSNFYSMIYRRKWLIENELRFPDARSGEDSAFMGQCYLVAERIAQNNRPLYHYVIYSTSLSHQSRVWRGAEKRKAFRALLQYARKQGLMPAYRWTLYWVYLKKAILTAFIDYIKSL